MKIIENLVITTENQNDFKDVTEVKGNIYISKNTAANFPELITSCNIEISENATANFPKLRTSYNIYINENANVNFPKLIILNYIYINQNAIVNFSKLTTLGNINISENVNVNFPKLRTSGNINISKNSTLKAPLLVEQFKKIGYIIVDKVFTQGTYLNLTEKEIGYLRTIKPLLTSGRVDMSIWHQNDDWKTKTSEDIINNCGTTHCLAGWIQIIENGKYNHLKAEECGKICAQNLSYLFFKSETEVETVINTLIKD
jgi:hypothetical protein